MGSSTGGAYETPGQGPELGLKMTAEDRGVRQGPREERAKLVQAGEHRKGREEGSCRADGVHPEGLQFKVRRKTSGSHQWCLSRASVRVLAQTGWQRRDWGEVRKGWRQGHWHTSAHPESEG